MGRNHAKGKKLYHNSIEQRYFFEGQQPEGWICGSLKPKDINRVAWNKGLTKHTDPRVLKYSISLSKNHSCAERARQMGQNNRGRLLSKEHKEALDKGRRLKAQARFSSEQEKEICELYLTPLNTYRVEQLTGISSYLIEKILRKYEIPKHPKEIQMQLMLQASQKSKLEKYGDPHYTNISRRLDTLAAKDDSYWEIRNSKMRATNLERFGVDNPRKSPTIKKKMAESKLTRYGDSTYNNRTKASITSLERYGEQNYSQTVDFANKANFNLYRVGDVNLDSFPELCIFLYFKQKGSEIVRNSTRLKYEFQGRNHYCFVDFSIDGKLVEVKGDYLYRKMQIEDTQDNAKLHCLEQAGVEIWTSKTYKFYQNWFKTQGLNKSDYKLK